MMSLERESSDWTDCDSTSGLGAWLSIFQNNGKEMMSIYIYIYLYIYIYIHTPSHRLVHTVPHA